MAQTSEVLRHPPPTGAATTLGPEVSEGGEGDVEMAGLTKAEDKLQTILKRPKTTDGSAGFACA